MPGDRAAYSLATGFGAGFAPVAPGTFGAVEGVAVFLAINVMRAGHASLALLLVLNVLLFVIGVWASSRTCEITRTKDPSIVVIDEVSGQLITLTVLALWGPPSIAGVLVGFLLFRLFDILKPFPIRRLERLPGGFGVMADDALAGVYAAALLWLGHLVNLI